MDIGFKLLTGYDLFSDSTGFLLEQICFPGTGERRVVTSLTIEPVERGQQIKPTFNLQNSQVQELFNQLWRDGYRPKDGTGNSGHVEALKYHLEDMRKLVFEKKP